MTLEEVAKLLEARFFCGEDKDTTTINSVYAGDLMSDLLANAHSHDVLITGLVNPQVVRTAEMVDLAAIVFVNGKEPSVDMVAMATQKGIPMLCTAKPMLESCALMFSYGGR
ncbi:MAG TPA: DRTGG domain-containing protein [Bacillota bacterium]|nr:DRTGG domain-containing protein [Bacillota bacterium]